MKFRKFSIVMLCCTLFLNMQCDEDDGSQSPSMCDANAIVDNSVYENAESDFYNAINGSINEDCLSINVTASGCSGDTWVMELIGSEDVSESLPPQRYLKFKLTNNEACLAVFEKQQSFDISALREEGVNEVILNIEDFPEPVVYSY